MAEFVNEVLENIWKDRYRKNEETYEQNLKRVADYCGKTDEEKQEFYNVMKERRFFPAGRTMSNAGIGRDLTLNNCFCEGAKVITDRGLVNIEDVKIGDKVITEDGSWQPVVNVLERDYEGDLFEIKSLSIYDDIICTPNHNFLTQNGWKRADRLLIGKNVQSQDRLFITPMREFEKEYDDVDLMNVIEGSDDTRIVENGDKIFIEKLCNKNRFNNDVHWMRVNNDVNRYLKMTPEFRYFIGRWIGDGSITKYKDKNNHSIIQIVFNATKEVEQAERCREIGEKTFGLKAEWKVTSQNIIAVRWANEILATWFYKEFGEKCDGKHLDDKYIGDFEIAKGIFDADGCVDTHGAGKITLKNLQLIQWLKDTLYLNGINTFDVCKVEKYENTYSLAYSTCVGKGRMNKFLNKTYHDQRVNKDELKPLFKDYANIKEINVIENAKCKVYNLSVENINSYTVNGVVVHNCFVAPQIPDDLSKIFDMVSLGARTHQRGGGIGYDFSQLRPKGAPTSNDAIASGAVSFMDVFNAQTATILQGNRRGANMGVMNIYDIDIMDFIDAKAHDTNKLNHFNLSVMVDDDFLEAVKYNNNVWLHHPVYDEYGSIEKDESKWQYKKSVAAKELWDSIIKHAYDNGEPGIFFYDNMNEDNNLWYIEKVVCSNPCAEYLAGTVYGNNPITGEPLDPSQYGGACNLGSLFLHNFVKDPFTSKASVDYKAIKDTVFTAVKFLDNIIDINKFPDQIYENYQRNFRTIGLGVTGLADMIVMMGMKYNSTEAALFVDGLMNYIALNTYKASVELAKQRGEFPFIDREKFINSGYITKHLDGDLANEWRAVVEEIKKYGIRNAKMMSIAPTGTLSLTFGNNCSSGLEPIFSLEYERKVKMGGQSEEDTEIVKMRDFAYGEWLKIKDNPDCVVKKEDFVTALEMSVREHINMLGVIAYHIDMSCSKTINVPTDYSFEDTKEIYMICHDLGIKGCTIFRPNAIREGIMITDNKEVKHVTELKRGMILKADDNCIGLKRTLQTGCGTLHCEAFFDPATGGLLETYFSKGSSGGCNNFMIGLSRMISLAARGGIDIYSIIDQLSSCGVCPSYAVRQATRHDTSKGSCCPVAIGNALLDMYNEFQREYTYDDEAVESVKTAEIIETPKNNPIDNEIKCPECGEPLMFEGGCVICKSCGYTKCE